MAASNLKKYGREASAYRRPSRPGRSFIGSVRVTFLLVFSLSLIFVLSPETSADEGSNRTTISSTPALREAVLSLEREEFDLAYELFKKAERNSPADGELRSYFAHSVAVLGFRAYEDGRYEEAHGLFLEAVKLHEDLEFYKGLAMSSLKLGDGEGALAVLLPYKTEPEIRLYLVDIYASLGARAYREGDIERAIVNFLLSEEHDTKKTVLSEKLDILLAQYDAEDGFRTKEGSHFTVKFEAGENAVAGSLVSLLLEEAYLRLGYDFGYYPKDRIEAVLYTREQFHDITKSPSWVGALYDGRIKLPVGGVNARTDMLESVLFHEYAHAVVHRAAKGRAPVWLNEGIAQYVEGKRIDSRKKTTLQSYVRSKGFTIRNLEGSFMKLRGTQVSAAYGLSLSATEYIISEFGSFSAMRILEYLGEGMSLDAAVKSSIYISYDELNESWLRNLNR